MIQKIKNLTAELLQYCHEYYDLDSPTISDAEYDKKFDILKAFEDETGFWLTNSPTRKVQGQTLPYLEKVKHSVPMLSADKSTNINDVVKFINERPVVVSFKEDGATLVVKYQNGQLQQAITRGSGIEGEIVTHTAKMIKNLPMTIPYKQYLEVRGEAAIPWKCYDEMSTDGSLGHPRNIASGGLRQLSAQEAAKRNIYFYAFTLVNWKDIGVTTKEESLDFLSKNGFDVVPHVLFSGNGDLTEYIKCLNRETYDVPTDGWCFEYNDLAYGESLGSTEHHDRKLYALKPEVDEYTTIFRGISYNTCRTGVVSLTAVFDPVEIDNTTVSRATLHNVDFFKALELGVSDEIVVTKMNCIIPGILDNHTRSNTYELIDTCPTCGEKLIVKSTGTANVLYCENQNCPARHLAQFENFVSKKGFDIKGLSTATLDMLISHGFIHKYRDIFHLSDYKSKLALMPGMGTKSVLKLLDSISESKNVTLDHFICALGIPTIGASAAKTISDRFEGDYNMFIQEYRDMFDWRWLTDFGETMSENLDNYLDANFDDIQELAAEMNFIIPENNAQDNSLSGLRFCLTGTFSQSRDTLKSKLEARGAKFVSSVSKNLDVLFAGDKAGSKLAKAQQLGVRVADEEELIAMLS